MKKINHEKNLIYIIRILPAISIILITATILNIIYNEFQNSYKNSKEEIKTKFINEQKMIIKNDVNLVYKMIKNTIDESEDTLKNNLKQRTYEIYRIILKTYNKNSNKEKNEIIKDINNILSNYNLRKGTGNFIIKKYTEDEEKKDHFENYINKKSKENMVSYHKYFKGLDIIIGSEASLTQFKIDTKEKLLKSLENMTLSKENYFYIVNKDIKLILHPNQKIIGKGLADFDIFENLTNNTFSKKERYFEYIQKEGNKKRKKIGYFNTINQIDWKIGKSFYIDTINNVVLLTQKKLKDKYKEYYYKVIVLSIFTIFIILIFSYGMSKFIENTFNSYKKSLKKQLNTNLKQEKILYQQSKFTAMGEMINNLAHQWRQPLSIISTLSSGTLLKKEFNQLEKGELEKNLETITNTSNELSKTIEDFREFFKQNKEKKTFKLVETVNKVYSLLEETLTYERIKIIIKEDEKNIILNSFEEEILQVILSLLNNSIDAFKTKNIRNKKIEITVKKECHYGVIQITDNAGGIHYDIKDKIFEPYFSTKHNSQGTGISLYMSKQTIEKNLNGKLFFKSEKKETTFIIKIPLASNIC